MAAEEQDELAALVSRVDDLIARAAAVRRRWEELGKLVLGERAPGDEPEPAPGPADDADPRLLIALDMALSGRTREEAGDYLRETFGPDGLDEVLAAAYEPR